MVTGVETAGLVLAIFPLVVKGIKSWVEGVETLKSWRRARLELKRYAARAQSQYTTFLDTVEQLLADIVQSDQHLAEMLNDPGGSLWCSLEYEERLRIRLDRSYDQFLSHITEVRAPFVRRQRQVYNFIRILNVRRNWYC